MKPALVELEGVAKYFDVSAPWLNRVIERQGRKLLHAVDGVSFQIHAGETLALVGESGCGKSTIARLIVGLYAPTRGTIRFDGQDTAILRAAEGRTLRRRLQMIFQDPYASLNPRWTVGDIVAEPIRAHALIQDKAAVLERAGDLLHHVGLSAADREKYPHQFSGGQRQRISIARALASNPEFLVCDEPTSALDVSVQAQVLNLMKDLQRELKLTYLFISHNLAVVHHIADRVGVMYLGRAVEIAEAKKLVRAPKHPYTQALLSAVPVVDPDSKRRRIMLPGDVPSPIAPPPGCTFHPRCPVAEARCATEIPALREVEPGHWVSCHLA